jgi:hypothetical protein
MSGKVKITISKGEKILNEEKKDRYFAVNDSKGNTYGWIPDFWVLGDSQNHNKRLANGNREKMQFLCNALNENENNKLRLAELENDKVSLHQGINDYFSNDESLDRPVCCSGSIQDECGCRGITGRGEIEYWLRNEAAKEK